MALGQENPFAKTDVLPSWLMNALQRFISTDAPSFQLTKQDATHVQVVAGSADQAAVIAVAGKWRWIEATINRSHPGGAAGTWDIYVVAAANKITGGGIDETNRAFDLRILESGKTPTIEAGVVDIFRKVGSLQWSGTEITRVDQTVPLMATHAHRHAVGQPDALAPADIGAAPLASPGLTGTPTAPTAAAGTNTTQLATTAFVRANAPTFSPTTKYSGWAKVATAVTAFELEPSATRPTFVAFEVEKNSGTVSVTISVGGEVVYKGVAVEGAFPAVQLGLPVNPGQVLKIECTTVGKINVYTSVLVR